MTMQRFVCTIAVAAMLAGCAGRAGTALPAPAGVAQQRKGKVAIHIRVPRHPKRVRVMRDGKPRYVSAATQGMTIAVTGPASVNETVGLTPTSTGCTSTATSVLCSLALSLAPGAYTATITTFDAVSCLGVPQVCTIPGGATELSTAQAVPFTVVAGVNNTVDLTLAGIPARILAVPNSLFSAFGATGGLNLIGLGPHPVLLEALDADGNVMIGPGSPSFTLVQTGGSGPVLTITPPSSTAPNRFVITPPATYTAVAATLTLGANFAGQPTDGCAQPGAVCSATLAASMVQMLAVVNNTAGFGNSGAVSLFALGDSQPFVTMHNDTNDPVAIAADASGDLFVGQRAGQSVLLFAAGSATVGCCVNDITAPVTAVAVDASNDLYVAESGATPTVLEYAPGTFALTRSLSGHSASGSEIGITNPVSLATDSGGRLYVLNGTAGSIASSLAEYDPSNTDGTTPLTASTSGFGDAAQVAVAPGSISGSDPQSFVADPTGIALWRFPYNDAVSNGDLSAGNGASNPVSVLIDPSVNVYAGNSPGNDIVEWSGVSSVPWPGAHIMADYSIGIDDPVALALDAAGDLIVANAGTLPATGSVEIFPAGSRTPFLTLGSAAGISAPLSIVVVP